MSDADRRERYALGHLLMSLAELHGREPAGLALLAQCSRCSAKPGRTCTRPDGSEASVHAPRLSVAVSAYNGASHRWLLPELVSMGIGPRAAAHHLVMQCPLLALARNALAFGVRVGVDPHEVAIAETMAAGRRER